MNRLPIPTPTHQLGGVGDCTRTYGHGFGERGGNAECEEVARSVIQRLHWQRAIRRQLGSFFFSGRRADIFSICLGLLHVKSAKRLHERIELRHRSLIHSFSDTKEGEGEKLTLLTSRHGPPGANPVRHACTIPGRSAALSSGPNPRSARPCGR
jgi:hypothetical protein